MGCGLDNTPNDAVFSSCVCILADAQLVRKYFMVLIIETSAEVITQLQVQSAI